MKLQIKRVYEVEVNSREHLIELMRKYDGLVLEEETQEREGRDHFTTAAIMLTYAVDGGDFSSIATETDYEIGEVV